MNSLSTTDLITKTRELLRVTRTGTVHIGQNLYLIKTNLSPAQKWADVLLEEFDLSEGSASRLMTIYKRLCLAEGGVAIGELEGIDTDKLYNAARMEGTPEERLAKARTLTRKDLRQEKAEEDAHEPSYKEVCTHPGCWLTRESHP